MKAQSTLCAWEVDPSLRGRLRSASDRYATLIGVLSPLEVPEVPISDLARDILDFPRFVRRVSGEPVWNRLEAIAFVCDRAGVPPKVSASWLDHAYPECVAESRLQSDPIASGSFQRNR